MALTVKKVIEGLQKCDPDAPVRIYADHGQSSQMASMISVMYTTEPCEFSTEEVHVTVNEYVNECDGEADDLSAFVEIS